MADEIAKESGEETQGGSTQAQAAQEETASAETKAAKKTASKSKAKAAEKTDGAGEKTYVAQCKARAGKKILGVKGNVIQFDSDGNATVGVLDAQHLAKIPNIAISER